MIWVEYKIDKRLIQLRYSVLWISISNNYKPRGRVLSNLQGIVCKIIQITKIVTNDFDFTVLKWDKEKISVTKPFDKSLWTK